MARVVLVCANDLYVAKTYFTMFIENDSVHMPELIEATDISELEAIKDKVYAVWKDSTAGVYYYYTEDDILDGYINFIYVPFAGLCHAYLHDLINNTDNRYCMVSIREAYNTQLITLGLFNIYLDSKFVKLSLDTLTDIIDTQTENNLISSDMDPVKEMITAGSVVQLSELADELVSSLGTSD